MPEILVRGRYVLPIPIDCEWCAHYFNAGHGYRSLSPFGRLLRDLMLSGF